MKAFRFRMQTSLDVRFRQEDRQKQVLQDKLSCYEESVGILNRLLARQEDSFRRIRQLQQGSLDVRELEACTGFVLVVKAQIEEQKMVVEHCRKAVEEAREKLLEIVKARKILEKLKERHFEEYRREELREQQKLIDEMAARRTGIW